MAVANAWLVGLIAPGFGPGVYFWRLLNMGPIPVLSHLPTPGRSFRLGQSLVPDTCNCGSKECVLLVLDLSDFSVLVSTGTPVGGRITTVFCLACRLMRYVDTECREAKGTGLRHGHTVTVLLTELVPKVLDMLPVTLLKSTRLKEMKS